MKRRTFLSTAGAAAASAGFSAPAIAKGTRELKLVCSWTKAERYEWFGRWVTEASDGRLKVTTYFPGELVDAFEVFDAVSEGVADMYWSADYYWLDRSSAYSFFTVVPYGLTPTEMLSWLHSGGGQELWDELSGRYNIKPLAITHSGYQMGGWYAEEITSVESFKGLRIRIPGLGGEVLRRVGAVVVNLPSSEIVPALRSGALDAAEWIAPENDYRIGLHTAAKYYYYPGFHEPGNINSLGINTTLWDSLSSADQSLIKIAAAAHYSLIVAEAAHLHPVYLAKMVNEHGVQLRKFDDEILRAFAKATAEVVAEIGAADAFTQKVHDSYMSYLKSSREWTDISQRAYLNARALVFS